MTTKSATIVAATMMAAFTANAALAQVLGSETAGETKEIPEELLRKLRSLGYLNSPEKETTR